MNVLKLAMKVVEKDNKKEPIMKPGHCLEAVSLFHIFSPWRVVRSPCHQDSQVNGRSVGEGGGVPLMNDEQMA